MHKTTMYALCVAHQELRLAGRRKEALKFITAELYVTNLRDEVRFHLVHHFNLRDLVDQYGLDEHASGGRGPVPLQALHLPRHPMKHPKINRLVTALIIGHMVGATVAAIIALLVITLQRAIQ